MKDYKIRLGDLAEKLKQEPLKVPIQEVKPTKKVLSKEPETQFNNWVPKSLLKRLKTFSVEHDLSLKSINIMALELFLKSKIKL